MECVIEYLLDKWQINAIIFVILQTYKGDIYERQDNRRQCPGNCGRVCL